MGVDAEFILKKNPDFIWIIGGNPKFSPDFFYNNPVYADLDAVKNHRIYKLPLSRWTPPGQEFPLAFEWFTRTVHPDLLGGSIRDSINKAYPMLYGHLPDETQMKKILGVEINKDALDYDKVIQ